MVIIYRAISEICSSNQVWMETKKLYLFRRWKWAKAQLAQKAHLGPQGIIFWGSALETEFMRREGSTNSDFGGSVSISKSSCLFLNGIYSPNFVTSLIQSKEITAFWKHYKLISTRPTWTVLHHIVRKCYSHYLIIEIFLWYTCLLFNIFIGIWWVDCEVSH